MGTSHFFLSSSDSKPGQMPSSKQINNTNLWLRFTGGVIWVAAFICVLVSPFIMMASWLVAAGVALFGIGCIFFGVAHSKEKHLANIENSLVEEAAAKGSTRQVIDRVSGNTLTVDAASGVELSALESLLGADKATLKDDDQVNTLLTLYLSRLAFGEVENYVSKKDELLNKLTQLCDQAKHDVEILALLQKPDENVASSNTPLMLLVKMGNIEGVRLVLPLYDANSLLHVTSRKNSALHIALVTGQVEVVSEILHRAKELHVLDELLALSNAASYTAVTLLNEVAAPRHSLVRYNDFCGRLMGGDEVSEAMIVKEKVKKSESGSLTVFNIAIPVAMRAKEYKISRNMRLDSVLEEKDLINMFLFTSPAEQVEDEVVTPLTSLSMK